jgi:hypothetical protein
MLLANNGVAHLPSAIKLESERNDRVKPPVGSQHVEVCQSFDESEQSLLPDTVLGD